MNFLWLMVEIMAWWEIFFRINPQERDSIHRFNPQFVRYQMRRKTLCFSNRELRRSPLGESFLFTHLLL
ncbi:hypothetical protein D2Q93_14995 [Alicyclobacillaceae bacterium I2511]|nr:hypothetical protein D2Q93_14995 [Alicyclobacillaceae bacterium I2511]